MDPEEAPQRPLGNLEQETLELLSMSGETAGLLVEMLNYEDEETLPLERRILEPEVKSALDELRARGLVESEPGHFADGNSGELEHVLWWDITAEGLALVEALEDPDHDYILPVMETDHLLLRQWRDEDFDAYARICADPVVMRYMGNGGAPSTRGQAAERFAAIRHHWRKHRFGLWAVEEKASGEFIGRIGLQHHEDWPGTHKVEVGWLLDRSCWGRGLATEGARASLTYGFERRKLDRVISIALPENVASRRVMEKCGFVLQGEARWKSLDMVWYAIDRNGRVAGR